MNAVRCWGLVLLGCLLGGCAHQIVITPELKSIEKPAAPIDKKVGYYISAADRAVQVTSAGGGGDKVSYYPYRELEPALQKVLFNVFRDVQSVSSPNDGAYLKQQGIAYVFVPKVQTDSSSSGVFTWMPTHFVVSLSCIAYDSEGKQIWQRSVSGTGDAEYNELKGDFSAAARKASQNAFSELEKAIIGASELH